MKNFQLSETNHYYYYWEQIIIIIQNERQFPNFSSTQLYNQTIYFDEHFHKNGFLVMTKRGEHQNSGT